MNAATAVVAGAREYFGGCADLRDLAFHEDRHPIGDRHCLFLIVCHVHGGAERALKLAQLDARFESQLGIEVRQRLIEQRQPRLAHDRAG